MGSPPGSRNKSSNHNAGGKRPNSGRKKQTQSNNLFNCIQNPGINADSKANDNTLNSASEQ